MECQINLVTPYKIVKYSIVLKLRDMQFQKNCSVTTELANKLRLTLAQKSLDNNYEREIGCLNHTPAGNIVVDQCRDF